MRDVMDMETAKKLWPWLSEAQLIERLERIESLDGQQWSKVAVKPAVAINRISRG